MDYLTANWPWVLIILLIVIVVAWWALGGPKDDAQNEASSDGNILKKAADTATGAAASAAETVKDTADRAVSTAAGAAETVADTASDAASSAKDMVTDAIDALKPKIAAAVGDPDDLRKIKGVGPKLNTLLGTLGVSRYDQIAAWTAADIAEVDAHLGNFKGRVSRDNWTDQAAYLAKDDVAGFEKKYGKL